MTGEVNNTDYLFIPAPVSNSVSNLVILEKKWYTFLVKPPSTSLRKEQWWTTTGSWAAKAHWCELALCPAALLPELQPASCFLSAIIGQID